MVSELSEPTLCRKVAEPCWSICRLGETPDPTATGGDASSVGGEEPFGLLAEYKGAIDPEAAEVALRRSVDRRG